METSTLSASQEDYLEAILALEREHGRARGRDLSDRLQVHKSTVTAALKMLAQKELIEYAPYGRITLTASGRTEAERVLAKHKVLEYFLHEILLVDGAAAEANACRMEHVMDREVLSRLSEFTQFMAEDRDGKMSLIDRFRRQLAGNDA